MNDEQIEALIVEAAKQYAKDCGAIYEIEGLALERFKELLDSIMTQQRC